MAREDDLDFSNDEEVHVVGRKVLSENTRMNHTPDPDDDYELEIVDDTPDNLKGKSKEADVPAASEEELEKINSERVVKRIQQLNRGLNYERDRAAALEREKEEAFNLAKAMIEENKKLKGSLNQGQAALIDQAKKEIGRAHV